MSKAQVAWLKVYQTRQDALANLANWTALMEEAWKEHLGMIKTHDEVMQATKLLHHANEALDKASAELAAELRSTAGVLIQFTREEAIEILGDLMSNISEEIWSAGWMSGLEETIPRAVRGALTYQNGTHLVTLAQAKQLQALADYLGHWATLNDERTPRYKPYTPTED